MESQYAPASHKNVELLSLLETCLVICSAQVHQCEIPPWFLAVSEKLEDLAAGDGRRIRIPWRRVGFMPRALGLWLRFGCDAGHGDGLRIARVPTGADG